MSGQVHFSDKSFDEFVEFNSDMLAFVNSGRGALKIDWDLIGDILQRIFLVRAGLASDVFCAQLDADLDSLAPSERVRQRLWNMAVDRVIAAHGNVFV